MNFLSKYGDKVNYKKKKVQFCLDNSGEFNFDKGHILCMMISCVEARKILSKGCMGYLAHIVNKMDKLVLSLQNTSLVYEFQDKFPNNLSGLAPKRKVEFNIEVALKTTYISRVLYKMT